MKAIRKINNNVVVCLDSSGQEVVAMGKGIGFHPVPREIKLSEIERTFYDLDQSQQYIIRDLDNRIVSFSGKIVDIAKNELNYELSPNVILNLADHISFAIERCRKHIKIHMPLAYDLEQYYPKECAIGRYVCRKIEKEYLIYVPETEVAGIAMTFINARVNGKKITQEEIDYSELQEDVTTIIEDFFKVIIPRNTFNYSRFATHLNYLFARLKSNEMIQTQNLELYNNIVESFPNVMKCVEIISSYLEKKMIVKLSEEEKLYLALHVNRIYEKEKAEL